MSVVFFGLAIWALITGVAIAIDFFSNKKTLLTGPPSSGKTTFLRYMSKEEIPPGASGAPRSYKVENALFNEVTDFSGADAWLKSKFDEYVREHDYILFFFDVSEYVNDSAYRKDSNARMEFIYRESKSNQTILLVGTHIDKVTYNYKYEIETQLAGKPYQTLLNRVVYIDTTKEKCVDTIINELKKKL